MTTNPAGRTIGLVALLMIVPLMPDRGTLLSVNDGVCEGGRCCAEPRSICNDGGKDDHPDAYLLSQGDCPKNEE